MKKISAYAPQVCIYANLIDFDLHDDINRIYYFEEIHT